MTLRSRLLALEKDAQPGGPNPFSQLRYQMEKQGEFNERLKRFDAGLESERPEHPSIADGGWSKIEFTQRDMRDLVSTMRRLSPPT